MKNVGSADKIIRYILAIIIAVWGYTAHSWWGLVALVPLGTALIGWCPAYLPFKISTSKKK